MQRKLSNVLMLSDRLDKQILFKKWKSYRGEKKSDIISELVLDHPMTLELYMAKYFSSINVEKFNWVHAQSLCYAQNPPPSFLWRKQVVEL